MHGNWFLAHFKDSNFEECKQFSKMFGFEIGDGTNRFQPVPSPPGPFSKVWLCFWISFRPNQLPLRLWAWAGRAYWKCISVYNPLGKKVGIFLTPKGHIIPKPLMYAKMIGLGMKMIDFGLDFDGIQFYKLLASSLHPTGAFSPIETPFLEIFNMSPIILSYFLESFCVHKPWVSKLHPAGAFSFLKSASLETFSMGIIKVPVSFQAGCSNIWAEP